jgi:hypothetical protein
MEKNAQPGVEILKEVKPGQSLHIVKEIIEGVYKQNPELEEEVKREELSVYKYPLPKINYSPEKEQDETSDLKEITEYIKTLKRAEELQSSKMNRREIEEEFEKSRKLFHKLDKMVNELHIKRTEMEDRYIRREQELRNRIKEREEEIGRKGGLDQLSDRKTVSEIRNKHTDIISAIDDLQKKTDKTLEQERNTIKTFFQGELMKLQETFDKQKESQATSSEGQKEDEKELRANLELVTNIAQHIDTVNRKLAKRKDELKIEVKAQENDTEMLEDQLAVEKNKTKRLEKELEKLKKIAADAKLEYEQERSRSDVRRSMETSKIDRAVPLDVPKRRLSPNYNLPQGEDTTNIEKYEVLITQLKKRISLEQANVREVRTMYTKEIETRLELEQLLRKCVDDVKAEITTKRAENRVLIHNSSTTLG